MKSRLFLPWSLLVGLFLLTSNAEAARATTLILGKSKPEPKIDIPPTAEEDNVSVSVPANSNLSNETINVGNVTKLTGVPQIDYIYDPNLPRELNGYNLTDYPFYNAVPEDIDFKCDGLHDGFYASVPHKCQVYHHCLFGTRYDFLCANYTAFDQKTFICHFASEVDCKNSPRYFVRNEALYKAATTTTAAPFVFPPRRPPQESHGGRKRKPYRRKKPSYEYYDEYEDAAEDDYYDDASSRRRKRPRPSNGKDSYDEADDGGEGDKPLVPSAPNKSIYDRPRVAPKVRRPVPVNEREKYDYNSDSRIIAKEPEVEKKKVEDSESSGRKQANNKESDYYESTGSKHVKNVEPDTEREREREHKERDEYEDRDRDRERDRDRDRDRERDRGRERDRDERPYRDRRPLKKRRRPEDLDDYYDEYDDVRRHRNRNRPRYEEYDDYEYDDRQYRNSQRNRDGDYRSRDHEYDRDKPYRARDPEYERPYRNRDRIRDDDRPIRNRDVEDRPARGRDERPGRNRDEEAPVRSRDAVKDQEERPYRNRNDQPFKSNRNRDEGVEQRPYQSGDENGYRSRGADDGKRVKETYKEDSPESRKPEEEERQYKYKESEGEYNNKQTTQDRNRNQERPPRYRESLDKFGKSRTPSREVEAEEPKTKPDVGNFNNGKLRPETERPSFRNNDKPAPRPGIVQRTKFPLSAVDAEEAVPEDQNKPVPASRPAYITKPQEAVTPPSRKLYSDQNVRKSNIVKRPPFLRVPSAPEDVEESAPEEPPTQTSDDYDDKPYEKPTYQEERYQPQREAQQPPRYNSQDDVRAVMALNDELRPAKTEEIPVTNNQPRLKVPHEDSVPNEELAPRAPKFPLTTSRRRPFLPSRNGNSNLPRNLLPVGVKAVQPPRGFQTQSKKPEETEQGATQHRENLGKERQEPNPPSNLEFRAKVTTAIGVDQPKLTQYFPEIQSSIEIELPEYEDGSQNTEAMGISDEFFSIMMQKHQISNQPQPNPRPYLTHPQGPPQGHPSKPNTQDLSSSHPVPEYTQEGVQLFRQNNNPGINFRPTLKPTDFPQLSVTNAPPSAPHQEERHVEQSFRNRPQLNPPNHQPVNQPQSHPVNHQPQNNPVNHQPQNNPINHQPQTNHMNHQPQTNQFAPKNPVFFPPPPPKPAPVQPQAQSPQLGFQSFYSENPKFKTTIKVPEAQQYKPSGPGPATQPPVYVAGIRQNPPSVKSEPLRYDNFPRQIDPPHQNPKHLNLKFPPQSENVEDPDEFDVSLNDALQPISTLHPRNVPTGIFLSSWQQPSGGFRRRIYVGGPAARASADPDKQEFGPRASADSRNVPNQPKTHKVVIQRQASSNIQQRLLLPPVYHPLRPVTTPGKYFAILN